MSAEYRLTPTMVSRKLQALAFIKRYFSQWGKSPSYGEIAAALKLNNPAVVNRIIRSLEDDGEIVRDAGARRGIRLPDVGMELSEADVFRLLVARGFKVLDGPAHVLACFGEGVRNTNLPLVPELDHIPDVERGTSSDGIGNSGGSQGHARDRRPRRSPRPRRAA